jgi:hypothetical protein
MSAETMARNDAYFVRRARQFRVVAGIVMALIVAMMALTLFVLCLRASVFGAAAIQRIALSWLPSLFYLWAIWTVRQLFGALAAEGPVFRPLLASAMTRIGGALLLGAATTIATAPIILALTVRRGMGSFAIFNVPALTIGTVGLALIATAYLLRLAIRIQDEAAALRQELEEFV